MSRKGIYQVQLDDELGRLVQSLASWERRSRSAMIAMLVREALLARGEIEPPARMVHGDKGSSGKSSGKGRVKR